MNAKPVVATDEVVIRNVEAAVATASALVMNAKAVITTDKVVVTRVLISAAMSTTGVAAAPITIDMMSQNKLEVVHWCQLNVKASLELAFRDRLVPSLRLGMPVVEAPPPLLAAEPQ